MLTFFKKTTKNRKTSFRSGNLIGLILICGILVSLMPTAIYAKKNWYIKTDVGFVEDGIDPKKAFLNSPSGIAVDNDGAIYIADELHHRIRKVYIDENGQEVIMTIAGTGEQGYEPGELIATSASLNYPSDVAIDSQGNIYIADSWNHCIRKINTSGIISTYAGINKPGFSGENDFATSAELKEPRGIAIDPNNDNLYIADTLNDRIRFVDNVTKKIYNFAGNGIKGYSLEDDGGNALDARLNNPRGVFVDSLGDVWIADTGNHRIRKVDEYNNKINTVAGNGESGFSGDGFNALTAKLNYPARVLLYGDLLYISDTLNNRIRVLKPSGIINSYIEDDLNHPIGIAFDQQGVLYINNKMNNTCQSRSSPEDFSIIAGVTGQIETKKLSTSLNEPEDIAFDKEGNYYIADTGSNKILMGYSDSHMFSNMVILFAGTGESCDYFDGGNNVPAINAKLNRPKSILPLLNKAGNFLYISEPVNHCIKRIDLTTNIISIFAGDGSSGGITEEGVDILNTSIHSPSGLSHDKSNNLYFADKGRHCVYKIINDNKGTRFERVAGIDNQPGMGNKVDATDCKLNQPTDIWLDRDDRVFIADSGNCRVCVKDTDKKIYTVFTFSDDCLNKPKCPEGLTGHTDEYGREFLVVTNSHTQLIYQMNLTTFSVEQPYSANKFVIAGKPEPNGSFSGDGGPALQANLDRPKGVSSNSEGELFFADMGNNRIRKLSEKLGGDPINVIKTYAGLFAPSCNRIDIAIRDSSGVAVDNEGNVFFSDKENHRVMKINTNGDVEAVAGNGTAGFSGDGDDATKAQLRSPHGLLYYERVLYIVDKGNHCIRRVSNGKISTFIGNGYPGDISKPNESCLNEPTDIALDQFGNLYISDSKNHKIKFFDKLYESLTVIAGDGSKICEKASCGDGYDATEAQLNSPTGLEVLSDGNLLIADSGNNRIRIVRKSDGKIGAYIGSGNNEPNNDTYAPALEVNLSFPTDIVKDSNGFLYIADSGNNVVRIVGNDNEVLGDVYTIAGDGNDTCSDVHQTDTPGIDPESISLVNPISLALTSDGSQLFIADKCHRLIKVDTDTANSDSKNLIRYAGSEEENFSGDYGIATSASLDFPHDIAIDKWGNLYIADKDNNRIRKVSSEDNTITTIAGTGNADYNGDGKDAKEAHLHAPHSVAINSDGDIFIADTNNHRIRVILHTGSIIDTIAGNGTKGDYQDDDDSDGGALATYISLNSPQGIAIDKAGNLYIADTGNRKVRKINMRTKTVTNIATYENNLLKPCDVAVDQQRNVYVSDTLRHQILLISPALKVTPYAGNGNTDYFYDQENNSASSASLYSPTYIDIDAESNLYISDTGHHTIRKVLERSRTIETIAGDYDSGFSGESQDPVHATLNSPTGICVGTDRNIFISDTGNHYIRKIFLKRYPDWIVDTSKYQFQGKIYAKVLLDGKLTGQVGDRIALFVGNECRGVIDVNKENRTPLFYIQAWSDQETEEMSLKYYRKETDEVYDITEDLQFQAGMDIGPVVYNISPPPGCCEQLAICEVIKNLLYDEIVELNKTIPELEATIDHYTQYMLTLEKGWYMYSSFNAKTDEQIIVEDKSNCISAMFEFTDGAYNVISFEESEDGIGKQAILKPLKGFWIKASSDSCVVSFKVER